jgi:hypothetical protein
VAVDCDSRTPITVVLIDLSFDQEEAHLSKELAARHRGCAIVAASVIDVEQYIGPGHSRRCGREDLLDLSAKRGVLVHIERGHRYLPACGGEITVNRASDRTYVLLLTSAQKDADLRHITAYFNAQ